MAPEYISASFKSFGNETPRSFAPGQAGKECADINICIWRKYDISTISEFSETYECDECQTEGSSNEEATNKAVGLLEKAAELGSS